MLSVKYRTLETVQHKWLTFFNQQNENEEDRGLWNQLLGAQKKKWMPCVAVGILIQTNQSTEKAKTKQNIFWGIMENVDTPQLLINYIRNLFGDCIRRDC